MNRAKELANKLFNTGAGPGQWAAEFCIYGTESLYLLDPQEWKVMGEVLRVADEVLEQRKLINEIAGIPLGKITQLPHTPSSGE